MAKEFNRSVHARDSGEHVTCLLCQFLVLFVLVAWAGHAFGISNVLCQISAWDDALKAENYSLGQVHV